jgi:hypothetical protein
VEWRQLVELATSGIASDQSLGWLFTSWQGRSSVASPLDGIRCWPSSWYGSSPWPAAGTRSPEVAVVRAAAVALRSAMTRTRPLAA